MRSGSNYSGFAADKSGMISAVRLPVLAALVLAGAVLILSTADRAAAEPGDRPAASDRDRPQPTPVEPSLTSERYARPLPVELVEEPLAIEPAPAPKPTPAGEPASATEKSEAADNAGAGEEELGDIAGNPDLPDDGVTTLLNVKDAEISSLIKTFSKITKRNYIVDSNVKGKITIHLPTAVTMAEALRILDSVLLLKGFTTVPVGKNTWKVVTAKDAQQTTIPLMLATEDHPTDALVTKLVRLRHSQASDVQQAISSFVSKDGAINAFNGTNSLILIDSAANIDRLEKLVKQLDIPTLDQDLTIIPVLHAEAKDIADKINDILGEDAEKASVDGARRSQASAVPTPRPMNQPLQPGRSGANQTTAGSEKRALPLKVIPDERTNSIIVVADADMTNRVKALVEQLDSPLDQSSGRFYVYRLKHAEASELAEIVGALVGGQGGGNTGATGSKSKRNSGQSSLSGYGNNSGNNSMFGNSSLNSRNSRSQLGTSRTGLGGLDSSGRSLTGSTGTDHEGGKVVFTGDISIAADESTNSLIISASKSDYLRVKELIDQLDVKRRQVLVEATILEVSLDHTEGMGVELQGVGATDHAAGIGQTNFGGLTNILSNPAALSDLTLAAVSTGTLTLPGGIVVPSQAVLITAVSRNQDVNVLSTPTILATDNEEAQIVVGENVPFVTSTSTDPTNLNNTFNQIERQDVGIKLHLTPQISGEGDFVALQIMVEISNVVAGTQNDKNGPTTTIRTTETSVEVKNEQMIVTGGLISDTVTNATRGVPYLEDIPVLGNLFKREDDNRRRTNLLVFLTPRIIKDQFDARENTKSAATKLSNTIDERQVEPNRAEVLTSEAIDNVVDEVPPGPIKPTSIIPSNIPRPSNPEAVSALDRTQARIGALLETQKPPARASTVLESDEPIEVSVRPKLPNSGGQAEPAAPQKAPAKAAAAKKDAKAQPAASEAKMAAPQPAAENNLGGDEPAISGSSTYVVMRASDGKSTASGVLFADKGGTAGLEVVGALGSPSGRFFSVGRRYLHKTSGREFVCIGVFGSPTEASIIHPELTSAGSWNRLSPGDSIRLGRDGWIVR